ncbi:MAG: hypothetical protein Q8R55_07640 [Candidatus Taylorbacteria bacterium]|nr:hypothetical protein [Candidatus Taylorbacteria bacterium]
MRKRFVVGVVTVSILVSACASTSALRSRNDEKRRVQDEANEFYSAWRDHNGQKIWQLSSPFFKKENQEKEYVKNLEQFLTLVTDLDYSNFSVVYMSKKLAVTQADISLRLQEGNREENVNVCERIIWLRFPEGWRFQEPSLLCTYMPDKQRIEFLTKNLPK